MHSDDEGLCDGCKQDFEHLSPTALGLGRILRGAWDAEVDVEARSASMPRFGK